MKVYRDCINGVPALDNPAFVTIFDANNNVVQTLQMPLLQVNVIPPSINNPCVVPQNNVCVQEGIYEMTVNLPPLTGGYYIAYQRCCRNSTILNLISPGDVGTTYWEHIPGPEVVTVNNSPRFNLFPPIYICNGLPINFNHSATDPDGDVLVYSLCNPFNGLSPCCPLIGSSPPGGPSSQCPAPPASCPNVNTPLPYVSVPFAAPYSASYPMASNPAININPTTGLLNGTPTIVGQWVVGVCVSEYRNGILIATHHRDFQFNVIPCVVNVVSAIQTQTQFCTGLKVDFGNQSFSNVGSLSYFWNFGDLTTLSDTSSQTSPSYTYPVPGDYTVTLIATKSGGCADTTEVVFNVYPLLDVTFVAPGDQCLTGNNFNFTGGGNFQGTGTFNWSFGANAAPQSANTLSVSNVVFNAPGIYPIKFLVKENGCRDSVIDSVRVYKMPVSAFETAIAGGCDPFTYTFHNLSTSETPLSYNWSFSNGVNSSLENPTVVFTPPGVYSASLSITSSNGCVWTSTFTAQNVITVSPSPVSSFTANPMIASIFEPDISFLNLCGPDVVSWYYNFDDGTGGSDLANPVHTYSQWGDYHVTQTVTNTYGCPNTSKLLIKILPEFRFWIPNAFTPGNKDGMNDVFKPSIMGVENYKFMVFNRWGQLIYETNDTEAGWNGTFKGKPCALDVFVWKCEFKNIVSKSFESHVGHVTLIR